MPSIHINTQHHSVLKRGGPVYVRVTVDGYSPVLLRYRGPGDDPRGVGWLYIALDGTVKLASTQKAAVEDALGITLTNWIA